MAIRYWDEGLPQLALRHARMAMDMLRAFDLPLGCAEHLEKAMKEFQKPYAAVERQMIAAATAKTSSIRNHFDLAQLFFAKAMLGACGTRITKRACFANEPTLDLKASLL
ncbi:hypothetical protein BESB_037120 [Besnoitia besnoiti]|uniref:Uncharacterized protein n=1 Tax=Besnoitia besnoiti TaxID=94643 RepID=A0A2A9MJ85_BESBE|nr:hypothetical protein BESB_037120 [Besnoitia besnoiti]PFH37254.1 hypothetical protein BESB_037120 [Besnoitia besnoiti]